MQVFASHSAHLSLLLTCFLEICGRVVCWAEAFESQEHQAWEISVLERNNHKLGTDEAFVREISF